jgi:predicted nuclease with TOPRIM domain|uniref:C2 domain-containing protein n=1 Tax=Eutreptiella gymnastica TaxID=73025 RepID=A0A7S4GQ78_9EUGL|mmetsp:Transcript_77351/g.129804  ORF Transcript_77351/g.129804 Transcript_77351/m.129804 type:complete len:579 (+) Transcript_77351:44-1780(+)|eukprot:CAMPEP_0174284954 /NCGR_PEP_ID=MMETSP0809-20121228/7392_1 /TAXON_ID=73025 ORGANISM="Eutreptiella gymnastica-like, Strain CCMP1594" /NCGR_SAMPLE_ID=MMETSP0809 /ASSEMBLY_ACC=CAM_ASM_000658 /LENGTH=578 /DNA_ID=CAMNT_0015380629 /DNA_START=43 /DNA_END=1779 /DNA_ORIENTATION=-
MAASAAAALDAADGVIDGKYYGRDIVTVPSRSYGYQTYSQGSRYSRSALDTARALDAADGVMDGKYYGRDIVTRQGSPRSRYSYARSDPVTVLPSAREEVITTLPPREVVTSRVVETVPTPAPVVVREAPLYNPLEAENRALMARCGQLEDEMEYATHGLLSFCHKFRQASVENEELNAIMSRVEITLRKLRAARADLLEERNILEARVEELERKNAANTKAAKRRIAELEAEIARLEEEIRDLRGALAQKDARNAEQLRNLRMQKDRLIEQLKAEIAKLEKQLRSLQGLRTEIHDLREENLRLQELANRYLKLKADYDALLAEIAELKRENARLRDELARLKEGGDRYLRLKAEHDRLLADFEAQKRHLLRLEEQLHQANAEIQRLKAENARLRQENERLEDELNRLRLQLKNASQVVVPPRPFRMPITRMPGLHPPPGPGSPIIITVLKGENLSRHPAKSDINPYVKLSFDEAARNFSWKTKAARSTQGTAIWNETCPQQVMPDAAYYIVVELYDDEYGRDFLMGQGYLDLRTTQNVNIAVEVEDVNGSRGRIYIKWHVVQPAPEPDDGLEVVDDY